MCHRGHTIANPVSCGSYYLPLLTNECSHVYKTTLNMIFSVTNSNCLAQY